MSSNVGGLALLLSIAAVGVAGYGLLQDRSEPAGLDPRLADIEDRMDRIERVFAERDLPDDVGPSLSGLGARTGVVAGRSGAVLRAGEPDDTKPDSRKPDDTPDERGTSDGETPEALAALVDKAVAKKAAEMQVMRNKKPAIDVFASTLELTEVQRKAAEQNIVAAQRDIKALLEIPAEDGTNFMDELVEIMAQGMANPGKDPGRGMRLFGRLIAEKIPGTDQTYAARAEAVKQSLRNTFKRDWTPQQYATFETWQMDPSEVQGIEGSPWTAVGERVRERARALGAKLPEEEGR